MITKSGGGAMVVARRPASSPNCLAASVNTELLRFQLDQLHTEAESTRAKANSARLRLLRLSEAAENLRRQAVINVRTGKENDARDLLFQKKKVVEALEKAKGRIELLDQLSSKLNEAISVKETQLIGNIAMDLEVNGDRDSSPVRIVSANPEFSEDYNEDKELGCEKNSPFDVKSETDPLTEQNFEDLKESPDVEGPKEDNSITGNLTEASSYETFLVNLDRQLSRIEAELVTIINVSALVLSQDEKPENPRVQHTMELLEGIRGIREGIANVMPAEAKIS